MLWRIPVRLALALHLHKGPSFIWMDGKYVNQNTAAATNTLLTFTFLQWPDCDMLPSRFIVEGNSRHNRKKLATVCSFVKKVNKLSDNPQRKKYFFKLRAVR